MLQKKKKHDPNIRMKQSPEVIRVHKILGQLEGVERMIDSRRPNSQVLQQIQAAISGLISLKVALLKRHLNECLAESTQTADYSKLVGQVFEVVQTQIRK